MWRTKLQKVKTRNAAKLRLTLQKGKWEGQKSTGQALWLSSSLVNAPFYQRCGCPSSETKLHLETCNSLMFAKNTPTTQKTDNASFLFFSSFPLPDVGTLLSEAKECRSLEGSVSRERPPTLTPATHKERQAARDYFPLEDLPLPLCLGPEGHLRLCISQPLREAVVRKFSFLPFLCQVWNRESNSSGQPPCLRWHNVMIY